MGLPTKLILLGIVYHFCSSQLQPSFTFNRQKLPLTIKSFTMAGKTTPYINTQEQLSKGMSSNSVTTKENTVKTANTENISPNRKTTNLGESSITLSTTTSLFQSTTSPDRASVSDESNDPVTDSPIRDQQARMEAYNQIFTKPLKSFNKTTTSEPRCTNTTTPRTTYATDKISFLKQNVTGAGSFVKDSKRINSTSADTINYDTTDNFNNKRQWFSIADNESNLYNYKQELGITTVSFVCKNVISSCVDNCGMHLDSCSCDIYCEIYDVCCDDFQDVCHQVWSAAQQTFSGLLDVKVECTGEYTGYLVIAGCSLNATNSYDMTKCENDQSPVLSIGNLHFKNKFCLRCNGFNETLAEKWSLTFFISSYRAFPTFLNMFSSNTFQMGSSAKWIIPDSVTNMTRVCSRQLIDECPIEADRVLQEKCLKSKADVVVRTGMQLNLFKNINCAECHVETESYFCAGATKKDYEFRRGSWRFSAIISVSIDEEGVGFHLTAQKPFVWKRARCFGKIEELNCKIIECHHHVPLISNSCGLKSTDTCVGADVLLPTHSTYDSNCSSSEECIKETIELITEAVKNYSDPSQLPGTNVTYILKKKTSPKFKDHPFRFSFYTIYTTFTDPFPFTEVRFYDLYDRVINAMLFERGFRGEFSVCVQMNSNTWLCDEGCQGLNFTIRPPTLAINGTRRGLPYPNTSSSGGKSLNYRLLLCF